MNGTGMRLSDWFAFHRATAAKPNTPAIATTRWEPTSEIPRS